MVYRFLALLAGLTRRVTYRTQPAAHTLRAERGLRQMRQRDSGYNPYAQDGRPT